MLQGGRDGTTTAVDIRRGTLWFYTAHRYWGNEEIVPGNYFNLTPRTFVYTPDFSRPAFIRRTNRDDSVRLTWQASAKGKLALNYSNQYICNCYNTVNSNIPHEPATTLNGPNVKAQLTQATWNRPATNRLLFEAGWTFSSNPLVTMRQAGVEFTDIPLVELTTGQLAGNRGIPARAETGSRPRCRVLPLVEWQLHHNR